MELPRLVFLAGRMGSGKDFVAVRLYEAYGFVRLSWAEALYRELAARENVPFAAIQLHKAEYRQKLQELGERRRQENSNYWIERWQEQARRLLERGHRIVVPDTRHVNEAVYGVGRFGLVVRVETPAALRRQRITARDGRWDPAWEEHPSETNVDRLPVHFSIPGDLPAWQIVPELERRYAAVVRLEEASQWVY